MRVDCKVQRVIIANVRLAAVKWHTWFGATECLRFLAFFLNEGIVMQWILAKWSNHWGCYRCSKSGTILRYCIWCLEISVSYFYFHDVNFEFFQQKLRNLLSWHQYRAFLLFIPLPPIFQQYTNYQWNLQVTMQNMQKILCWSNWQVL